MIINTMLIYIVLSVILSCSVESLPADTDEQPPYWARPKSMRRTVLAKQGDSMKLKCLAHGPEPVTTRWYRKSIKDEEPWEIRSKNDRGEGLKFRRNRQVMKFTNVMPPDEAMYTCIVSNNYGSINHTYQVQVADTCRGPCGINAHCNNVESKCQCNDGYFGSPEEEVSLFDGCVSRNDSQSIRKIHLGYLDSKPPSPSCPMESDKDLVLFPQCTMRETLSAIYGCWQIYSDGFPYGSNKDLCTMRLIDAQSCLYKTALRCLGSYCHNSVFFLMQLDEAERGEYEAERKWKQYVTFAKNISNPMRVPYYWLLKMIVSMVEFDWDYASMQTHFCPDLGEVPATIGKIAMFDPISPSFEEPFCKPGLTKKMQAIGKVMTYKWYSSKSKNEVDRAYEVFKQISTEAFLDHCSNLTKVHEGIYGKHRHSHLGDNLKASLAWKIYLVLTDFMIKDFYPESNIYDDNVWNSANVLLEDNALIGEIQNFLSNSDGKDNTDGV